MIWLWIGLGFAVGFVVGFGTAALASAGKNNNREF